MLLIFFFLGLFEERSTLRRGSAELDLYMFSLTKLMLQTSADFFLSPSNLNLKPFESRILGNNSWASWLIVNGCFNSFLATWCLCCCGCFEILNSSLFWLFDLDLLLLFKVVHCFPFSFKREDPWMLRVQGVVVVVRLLLGSGVTTLERARDLLSEIFSTSSLGSFFWVDISLLFLLTYFFVFSRPSSVFKDRSLLSRTSRSSSYLSVSCVGGFESFTMVSQVKILGYFFCRYLSISLMYLMSKRLSIHKYLYYQQLVSHLDLAVATHLLRLLVLQRSELEVLCTLPFWCYWRETLHSLLQMVEQASKAHRPNTLRTTYHFYNHNGFHSKPLG